MSTPTTEIPETPQTPDIFEQIDEFEAEPDETSDQPGSVLESLEPDEAICAGGPTRTEVEALKAKLAPGLRLMFTGLANNEGILWKTCNRGEWKALMNTVRNITDETAREDFIFAKIALFPDCSDHSRINLLPAGAVTTVMTEFYIHSGFQPVMETIAL
jgi:hypothetical protein